MSQNWHDRKRAEKRRNDFHPWAPSSSSSVPRLPSARRPQPRKPHPDSYAHGQKVFRTDRVNGKRSEGTRNEQPGKSSYELLMTLAPELFGLVLEWFHPSDLLALARTSKALRAHLVAPSAAIFWKKALSSIGLPPWPGFSGPAYAAFIADFECQGLGCNDPRSVFYSRIKLRYCSSCCLKNLMTEKEIADEWPNVPARLLLKAPSILRDQIPGLEYQHGPREKLRSRNTVFAITRRYYSLEKKYKREVHELETELQRATSQDCKAVRQVEDWVRGAVSRQEKVLSIRWKEVYDQLFRKGWRISDIPANNATWDDAMLAISLLRDPKSLGWKNIVEWLGQVLYSVNQPPSLLRPPLRFPVDLSADVKAFRRNHPAWAPPSQIIDRCALLCI